MIGVTFKTISDQDYDKVCLYYNKQKKNDLPSLEKLDRIEGGFCIYFSTEKIDENKKIRQLRWERQKLVTPIGCYGFKEEELLLLYESMKMTFGQDQVLFIK